MRHLAPTCFHFRAAFITAKLNSISPLWPNSIKQSPLSLSNAGSHIPAAHSKLTHFPPLSHSIQPNGSAPPSSLLWFAQIQLNHLVLWSSSNLLWKSNSLFFFFLNGCRKSIFESWAVWWFWLDSHFQMSSLKTCFNKVLERKVFNLAWGRMGQSFSEYKISFFF